MPKATSNKNLIFHCAFEVSNHTTLKSSKVIRGQRNNRFIGSSHKVIALKREITSLIMQSARKAVYGSITPYLTNINYPVRCQIKLVFPEDRLITLKKTLNKKCGDLSNLYQMAEDCLTAAGVLEDDCWIKDHSGSQIMISPDNNCYLDITIFKIKDFKYGRYQVLP